MHTLFNAALRWELCDKNPVDLVRQSAKRMKTPNALQPEEFQALIAQLSEPYRTMVVMAGCLGLRVSELVALKWEDIDFLAMTVNIKRSFVRGEINPTKTNASEGTLPMNEDLADMLRAHRLRAKFRDPTDYVFANDSGAVRWPESILTRHIKPAANMAKIGNVGWHTFRHTYSTLLHSLGTTPAVQKELLRHANVTTTLNVYTQAISEEKRQAAAQVSRMLYQFVPVPERKM